MCYQIDKFVYERDGFTLCLPLWFQLYFVQSNANGYFGDVSPLFCWHFSRNKIHHTILEPTYNFLRENTVVITSRFLHLKKITYFFV